MQTPHEWAESLFFRDRIEYLAARRHVHGGAVAEVAHGDGMTGRIDAQRELSHRETVGLQRAVGIAGEKQKAALADPEFGRAKNPLALFADRTAGLAQHDRFAILTALDH